MLYVLGTLLPFVVLFILPALGLNGTAILAFMLTLLFVGIVYLINHRKKVTIDGTFRTAPINNKLGELNDR